MNKAIDKFPGKLALQQRVLPAYRVAFFDALAACSRDGMSILAGQPQPEEQIAVTDHLNVADYYPTRNRHFLKVSSPFYQCWQEGLVEWLESWRPDALIVEANPRYLSTPLAVRWMHDRGLPVLGWGLGSASPRGPLASWRRWTRQRFLRLLDGLIAYSRRGAEEYRSLGVASDRIFVAPNVVVSRPLSLLPDRSAGFGDQPVVLFVGRLQERKRIDNLLFTCAALPENLRPRLLIVGDGPARASLEHLASDIYPEAEFAGALYGDALEAYFVAADLFVLPGTGGLAVQQAMSFGLPVVVAEGDGTQDDLVRAENGWRVPPGNLPALENTLRNALSDVKSLREKGRESFRIVAEEANLETMVGVFLKALASVSRNPVSSRAARH